MSTTQSDARRAEKSSNGVTFAHEIEEIDGEDSQDENDMTSYDLAKLTSKKKQYLQDAITDKNGAYTYLNDPIEYKKARKRL